MQVGMKKAKLILLWLPWLLAIAAQSVLADELTTADLIRFASAKHSSETAAAKLALQTSRSPEVMAYAQRMLDEQSVMLASLETLVRQAGVALDNRKPQAAYVFIRKGENFDRAYANKRAAELKRMVRVVRKAMVSEDAGMRHYAEQTLPLLMQHWYQTQQLVQVLNNASGLADSMVAIR